MEFNRESFEKALKANKIVRYQKHFETVVKSYLEAETEQCNTANVNVSLLQRSIDTLDDYLNAGNKDTRANAADKAKQIYKEYYGKEYRNRNER